MKYLNLIFYEIILKKYKLKIKDGCFLGYLKNDFEFCPLCGFIIEKIIIKKGNRNFLIKINKSAELTAYLDLIKQRDKCKNGKTIGVIEGITTNYLNKYF